MILRQADQFAHGVEVRQIHGAALVTHGGGRQHETLRRDAAGTQRTLTRQLRELETDGIMARTVYPEVPPRVEYDLTDFGKTLTPILEALYTWGNEYIDRLSEIRSSNIKNDHIESPGSCSE